MANRLGIRFDGFDTVGETIEIARLAEENGISGLWMTEHLGYREAMASCMAFLLATGNVTVVPAAVTPYLWHPTPTAMSLATMAGGEMDTAASLVSDDAVEAFAVGGTPRQCCDRLEAYRAAGLAEPVIQIGGTAEQKALAVQVVHEYLGA